ncbi:zinc ribbon domain-containing protein [Gimesia fumaroli]|uniref:Zinc-ribbon domain-containing protein n=1 Tax=Gimesia fumaroli TaxID=2527976 RepID=A0A518IH38_9PLAN|nr:zinc ribbon domain-containing protein [Gimesia fumaroli]QDV52406.1 hypothetical protein Enr17x_44680 [Gimesia fumaroli]
MDEDWGYGDEEQWDESEFDDDDVNETVACSNCGAEIYEDAVSCPICGEYITTNTHPFSDRPNWWITLGIVGVIATILSLLFLSGGER